MRKPPCDFFLFLPPHPQSPALIHVRCEGKDRSMQGGLIPAHTLERMAILRGKERVFAMIFSMTSSKLDCSSPGPLTSLGLVYILTTPCPLTLLGMAPTLFTSSDHATRRTDPFGSESSSLSLLKSTLDAQGQPDTLLAEKQAPVFIIRNICAVIPSAVIALSTGNRISPSLPCFFSAGLTGYLLLLPQ